MATVNEEGFGLVETIVTTILMSLVAAAIYGVFSYGNAYFQVGDTVTNLQQNAQAAMETISTVMREGNVVRIPSTQHPGVTSSDSVDIITSASAKAVSFFRDNRGNLFRNNNNGTGDTALINVDSGLRATNLVFEEADIQGDGVTDNNLITVRLRVRLTDSTVVEAKGGGHSGARPAIVLVEGVGDECGEDCIELYSTIIPRNRLF